MVKEQLALELGVTLDGLEKSVLWHLTGAVPTNIDSNTALTASSTFYTILGEVPKACTLISGEYRIEAVGVATTVMDIYKVANGAAITAGTTIVTQVDLTAAGAVATDTALTVTAAAAAVAEDSYIVAKVATHGGETVKGIAVRLTFAM